MRPLPVCTVVFPDHEVRPGHRDRRAAVARISGITGIGVFARVWTWLALGVSVFVSPV
jgi:hypothetical protein